MKKESLYRIRKALIESISKMDSLPIEDRVEGMINGHQFFGKDYEENVKVLRLHNENKRKGGDNTC